MDGRSMKGKMKIREGMHGRRMKDVQLLCSATNDVLILL